MDLETLIVEQLHACGPGAETFGGNAHLNFIAYLFEVAAADVAGESCVQTNVGSRLELVSSVTSRYTKLLLTMAGSNKPGFNMVEEYTDWDDRRRHYLRLTGHGKHFIRKLAHSKEGLHEAIPQNQRASGGSTIAIKMVGAGAFRPERRIRRRPKKLLDKS